jgi:hypothetical protein
MKSYILTSEYEFTHGKKPRGEGNWMFKITDILNDGHIEKRVIMKYGLLSELIKQIKKEYPNVYRIKVMP